MRDDGKASGTDAEKKLFTTEQAAFKKTATKLAETGVGIDVFISAGGGTYMDLATIGRWLSDHAVSSSSSILTVETKAILRQFPEERLSSIQTGTRPETY